MSELATRSGYLGEDRAIFATYHEPLGDGRDIAVLLCNPLGPEALSAHRSLRHLASALQAAGFPAMRFDYRGTGDSAGSELEPGLVEGWVASIGEAAGALRALSGRSRVALVGLRMGANLAMEAAAGLPVDSIVLWAPCKSGKAFMRQLRLLAQAEADGARAGSDGAGSGFVAGGFTWTPGTSEALTKLGSGGLRLAGDPAVLLVGPEGNPEWRSVEKRLAEVGATVHPQPADDFGGVLVAPHATVVPEVTIGTTVRWLDGRASAWDDTSPSPAGAVMAADRVACGASQEDVVVRFGPEERLFGILSRPAEGAAPASGVDGASGRGIGVVMLAGSVHRIGHNRMNVELAARFVASGYTVLRMDTGGLGDSGLGDGGIDNYPYPPHVADDVAEGIRLLRERSGARGVILTGLCAGAYASFHAGLADDRVIQGILVNPLAFYRTPGMSLDIPESGHAANVSYYRTASRDPRRWLRLLYSPHKVLRIVVALVGSGLERASAAFQETVLRRVDDLTRDVRQFSTPERRLSFVFAVGDAGYDILMTRSGRLVSRLVRSGEIDLEQISNANHAFTDPERREEMFDAVLRLADRRVRSLRE